MRAAARGRGRRGVRRRAPAPRPGPRRATSPARSRPRVRRLAQRPDHHRQRHVRHGARPASRQPARRPAGRSPSSTCRPSPARCRPSWSTSRGRAALRLEPPGHAGRRSAHGVGGLRAVRDAERVTGRTVGRALARHWVLAGRWVPGSCSRALSDRRWARRRWSASLPCRGLRRVRALGRLAVARGRWRPCRPPSATGCWSTRPLRATSAPARRLRGSGRCSPGADRPARGVALVVGAVLRRRRRRGTCWRTWRPGIPASRPSSVGALPAGLAALVGWRPRRSAWRAAPSVDARLA